MKKLLALTAVVVACSFTTLFAQGGGQMTPEQQKEATKTRLKESMSFLTDVQLDSVTNIVVDSRAGMRGFRDMSPEDRQAAMKKATEARDKRLDAALPKDVAQKVKDTLAAQQAAQMQRMQQGGGRPQGGGGGKK
jgi:hypothetical protein